MKLVWVIAIVLAILFGLSEALSFLSALWMGAVLLLAGAGIYMVVTQFIARKFGSALWWLAAAVFWCWIFSLCF